MSPYLIKFKTIGSIDEGFLNIGQHPEIPFEIKRVFWTQKTPTNIIRGRHAHFNTSMILIALQGNIKVETISKNEEIKNFELDDYNTGLYLPVLCWHEMTYSPNAIQLVITNTDYKEEDYIRDKSKFFEIIKSIKC